MSQINLKERTINAKIVYYGTALGGKTTSLKYVHRVVDPEQKVELVSLNTEKDRTLFFDFIPINLGRIGNFTVRLQGFTVPGQVKYNLTRKYVLTGADAVILVVDSRASQRENNIAALENLKENLAANSIDYRTIPLVLQYNKRDLPDALPVEELERTLNDRGVPAFETVATEGPGVFETFVTVARSMMDHICGQYRIEGDRTSMGEVLEACLCRHVAPSAAPPAAPVRSPEEPKREADAARVKLDADSEALPSSEELLRQAVNSNIEVARLFSDANEVKNRLQERVRELTALNEFGRAAGGILDEDRLLSETLSTALRSLGLGRGSVLLVHPDGSRFVEKVVRGFLRDPLAEAVLGPGGEPVLLALMQGRNLRAAPDDDAAALQRVRALEPAVESLLAAPLVAGERLLGLLVAYSLTGDRALATEHMQFLSALCGAAAVALQNARLVERIEAFNEALEQRVRERTDKLGQALAELREVDRLKDEFLSSVSHELLTPLTSIRSFSEILIATRGTSLPEPLPEFLSIIHREALRLTDRLGLLLDVSRIEAGKASFARESVDLKEVASEGLDILAEEFRAKGVETVIVSPPAVPGIVGDRAWVGRAVGALLGNALKFSGRGTRVEVEVRPVGREVHLCVEDEGPGIPAALQRVVFERFKQLGDPLTGKPAGVGLGLPLCRMIAEAHGGRIWVESSPGFGCRFTMVFPLPAPAGPAPERPGAPRAEGARDSADTPAARA